MAAVTAVVGAIGIGAGLYQGAQANKAAKAMEQQSQEQFEQSMKFQAEQQKKLDAQKEIYKQFQLENPYAGVENVYEGMENVYEDLGVSTQAAEFQMEQGKQQRADLMRQLRTAAGGSGIAGLAQTLAGQGAIQARQVATDISLQERQNAMMKAQGAATVEQLERQGASAADMARRGGEAMLQEAEMSRQSTLLGMEYGGMAGANQAVQSAMANQMSAMGASVAAQSAAASSLISAGGTIASMGGDKQTLTQNTDTSGSNLRTSDPTLSGYEQGGKWDPNKLNLDRKDYSQYFQTSGTDYTQFLPK